MIMFIYAVKDTLLLKLLCRNYIRKHRKRAHIHKYDKRVSLFICHKPPIGTRFANIVIMSNYKYRTNYDA